MTWQYRQCSGAISFKSKFQIMSKSFLETFLKCQNFNFFKLYIVPAIYRPLYLPKGNDIRLSHCKLNKLRFCACFFARHHSAKLLKCYVVRCLVETQLVAQSDKFVQIIGAIKADHPKMALAQSSFRRGKKPLAHLTCTKKMTSTAI